VSRRDLQEVLQEVVAANNIKAPADLLAIEDPNAFYNARRR
jgi:hypothetical protein